MTKKQPKWRRLLSFLPFVTDDKPLVTVLELSGVIGMGGINSRSLSFAKVEKQIAAAFKPSNLTAVALSINSPGGSPVQSHLIMRAIRRQAKKTEKPVLAFIEDAGASGGYMLACAGDEIFADESSIVGSIGVISSGFGFVGAIERLGIERRVYTAGKSKSQLDPFRPSNEDDLARLTEILGTTHEHFIGIVKERRGNSLNLAFDDIFTGAFWTAGPAKERGLIDDIARLDELLETRFGEDVIVQKISSRESPLKRLLGSFVPGLIRKSNDPRKDDRTNSDVSDLISSQGLGTEMVHGLMNELEERSFWARIGL
ncbi:MAG: S49 family peptidase [Pseudomonadota bacterium]